MGNTLEIHDGDFHLMIYLDKLHSFPRANFCRLLRLLRRYPDAMEQLGVYLREQIPICKAGWEACSREFVNGWRIANPRSRTPENMSKLSENKQLEKNLRTAKRLYTTYTRLLQIYENQGGTHK